MLLDERYKPVYLDHLCKLVRIPSRSTLEGGEEGLVQRRVAAQMRELGARVRTFEANDVPGFFEHPLCCGPDREYKDRPTIIGEVGPAEAPALLVLAHSDTVPVFTPEEWTFDPFIGDIYNGEVRGLGVTDDKWGSAALLVVLRALRDSGRKLKKKVIFASTIDEENGVGNGFLLLTLAGIRAECGLYLDGYSMNALIGNLGGSFMYLKPKLPIGSENFAHHSRSITAACEAISRRRARLFDGTFYKDNMRKENSVILYEWKDDHGPFFNVAFYTLPGEDREGICGQLERMVGEALGKDLDRYVLSYLEPWFEPSLIDPGSPMVRHVCTSVEEITGRPAVVTTVSKQDVFVLNNHAKIPTVSFGPAGRIAGRGTFHNPDEALPVEEAWNGCRIAYAAVGRWLEE